MPQKPTPALPKVSFSIFWQILFVLKQTLLTTWEVNPRLLAFTFILGGLTGLSVLPALYLGKSITDIVVNGITSHDIATSLIPLATLVAIRTLLGSFQQVSGKITRRSNSNLSNQVDAHIERLIAKKLATLDIETIEDSDFKDKFERIRRQSGRRVWELTNIVGNLPQDILGIASALTPIFLFSPILVGIFIVLVLPGIYHESRAIKEDYELDKELTSKNRLWNYISGLLSNKRDYMEQKLLGNTYFLVNKLKTIQMDILGKIENFRNNNIKRSAILDIPSWLFDAGYSVWLFIQAIIGNLTLGTAQMLYSASGNFQRYFGSISASLLKIFENYLYMVDFVWFLNLQPNRSDGTLTPRKKFTKGIVCKDVWFKYPKSKNWILKGVNLTIHPRENIAVIGENGAGKTTLIKLLGRFYEPTRGTIEVDGHNIKDYIQDEYWKRLSTLFQNFEHYSFSAGESIGYGDVTRISQREEIAQAASQTGINQYIESLPNKYDTPLFRDFEGGIEPSGGQWQRIALARSIFRNAEVIILDEPTSNVDPKGEEEIFDKVIKLTQKKILILISHRFSTVRLADKIFVMDKGRIVEEGSHEDLMQNGGLYAKLFRLQAKGYQ